MTIPGHSTRLLCLTLVTTAVVLVVVAALAGVRSYGGTGAATSSDDIVQVTVREGTSMAIALSPDKRQVAIDLQGVLWVVSVEGGAARAVTDEYGDVRQPDWSPDGSRIAFQSYRDGVWRIWTVQPDGADLKAVTSGPFDDREPHWSPDGTQIAFASDRGSSYDIWVLDVRTGDVRQVTNDPADAFTPTWSPDGREIAFVSTRPSGPGVYATTLDGTERLVAQAWGAVGTPSWSPDGEVLFTAIPRPLGRIAAVPAPPDAPDLPARLVLGGDVLATGEDYFPFRAQWLSDDEFLYPADGRIKRRSRRTGALAPVAFTATLAVKPAAYTRKPRDFDATTTRPALGLLRPVVSPDGTRLAFGALGDIWVQPIDGTPEKLTDDAFVDTDAAWSPDGTQIAFASDRAGSMDIWTRDLRTGAERRLTFSTDAEMAPAWSPDGQSIAYISNQAYEQSELHVVRAAGGEPRRLTERLFGLGYPSWTPDGSIVIVSAVQPYSNRFRESMNYYWTVPVDGGPADMVVPEAHTPVGKRAGDGPAIAPDGRHIAYVSNGFLHVQPIDARARPIGPARRLTQELADAISWAGPDRVLYVATDRLKLASVSDGSTRDVLVPLTWQRKVPDGRVVVHAGRLIDGVQPEPRVGVDVVIERNRIVAIEPHDAAHHTGHVVDAGDQTVFPGLIEGHGHTLIEHGTLFGRVHLAYGVTSFRDVGALPYDVLESREAIDAGRRVGPRVFTTGYLLDGARPYYPMASTAPTEAVVDLELERARRLDYDTFKTYVRLPDLLQKRAIEGAHAIGIPTSSHEIYPAALSGTDSVEHTGATSRRGYATKASLTGRAYDDVVKIVAASRMTITPTLGLGGFQAGVARDGTIVDDPRWQRLQPAWTQATVRARRSSARPDAGLVPGQHTVRALHEAGATIIAGVDSPLSPYATALHIELQDYVAAGLTPFEAIQTATRNTAILLGAGNDLGTLEAGKLADLVIVDGNPLANIADTLRVRVVVKNGEVFTVEQLLAGEAPITGSR